MVHITIVTRFSSRTVEMELKSHTETGLSCTGFKRIILERGRDSWITYYFIYDCSEAWREREVICML